MALDSPDNLKNAVLEGFLVQVRTPNAMEHLAAVESLPYVKECSIHGASLHVLLENESYTATLNKAINIEVEPITPSLEDVFIALARKQRLAY